MIYDAVSNWFCSPTLSATVPMMKGHPFAENDVYGYVGGNMDGFSGTILKSAIR